MSSEKFFRKPFAVQGDREPILDDLQASGNVSFDTGYGFDYERNPESDPLAKDIGRPEMNWLLYAITEVLRQYQIQGTFRYVTAEENGGNPYPYRKTARVLYEVDGNLDVYESLADNNTYLPTNAAKWQKITAGSLVPNTRKIIASLPLVASENGALDQDVTLGLKAANEGDTLVFKNGNWVFAQQLSKYEIGELYYFRHPTLKPGFQPAQGGVITNAATVYPEIWAYLQTTEGLKLCKSEAEWQAMSTANWHTNADGSKIGWNGIGGVPFFAPNLGTGSLRMLDVRGMYAEAFGYDTLGVGGVQGDRMRPLSGYFSFALLSNNTPQRSGVFSSTPSTPIGYTGTTYYGHTVRFNAEDVTPTGPTNAPRRWGALACAYLGQPTS